jgi:hypothetical protein
MYLFLKIHAHKRLLGKTAENWADFNELRHLEDVLRQCNGVSVLNLTRDKKFPAGSSAPSVTQLGQQAMFPQPPLPRDQFQGLEFLLARSQLDTFVIKQ